MRSIKQLDEMLVSFCGSVLLGFLSQTIKKMFYSLYYQLFIIHFSYHFFNSHLKTSKARLLYSYLEPSVQFSRSVVSNSLRPHESQHARPPCPSPTPRVHSNSRPSSQWCHPAIISSSVIPFSSCLQSLPASESFPVSQLFTWGGQSIGVSALASVPPKNIQDWSPLEWTGWISLPYFMLPS